MPPPLPASPAAGNPLIRWRRWRRRLVARWWELRGGPPRAAIATASATALAPVRPPPSSSQTPRPGPRRRRHPGEAPPVAPARYGQMRFRFEHARAHGFVDARRRPFLIRDLFLHVLVTGGSGAGKTYRVLGPLWEELFRCTHLPDGPERERRKFGALVIEAKGDFRDKTWACAQRYGRMDDCVYFGPGHRDVVYDPFGDPAESPLQLAGKMLALLKAFAGGKSGQDPFWDNSAQKLFLNLFTLHRELCRHARETAPGSRDPRDPRAPGEGPAEERGAAGRPDAGSPSSSENAAGAAPEAVEPLSFHLLNLLLLDRGHPRNQAELDRHREEVASCWNDYRRAAEELLSITGQLEPRRQSRRHAWLALVARSEDALAAVADPAEAARLDDLYRDRARLAHLGRLLDCVYGPADDGSPGAADADPPCAALREAIGGLFSAADDTVRAEHGNRLAETVDDLAFGLRQVLPLTDPEPLREAGGEFGAELSALLTAAGRALAAHARMAALLERPVRPTHGALRRLLARYEELLAARGQEPAVDPLWAYFHEEYLNVANDRTAGSVAMVASNLVQLFVHGVFKEIFAPAATFDFNRAIDAGQIVYLDMPTAYYGVAATVAALVFKIDFFRCVLSRRRLRVRAAGGGPGERLVNQDRPLFYFCDEFGSVATTGDETGEASFTDKCREFSCGCILAVQNLPALQKRIPEVEVDHILSCTATKVFLRNPEAKTNDYASKTLGTEIKVNANVNQGAAERLFGTDQRPGSRFFSTSHARGARFEATRFPELLDGEAGVILPPRFRPHHVQRVIFAGRSLAPPEPAGLFPVPQTGPD